MLLFDEPTALGSNRDQQDRGFDFQSKSEITVIAVTHNMQQAARISDFTALCISVSLSKCLHQGDV